MSSQLSNQLEHHFSLLKTFGVEITPADRQRAAMLEALNELDFGRTEPALEILLKSLQEQGLEGQLAKVIIEAANCITLGMPYHARQTLVSNLTIQSS